MDLKRDVVFFRHPVSEKEPVKDWLEDLKDPVTKIRILTILDKSRYGHLTNTKSLGQGLSEIKFHFGPGYRIYYALHGLKVILLLTAGDKSSQRRDIVTAREYLNIYKKGLKDD